MLTICAMRMDVSLRKNYWADVGWLGFAASLPRLGMSMAAMLIGPTASEAWARRDCPGSRLAEGVWGCASRLHILRIVGEDGLDLNGVNGDGGGLEVDGGGSRVDRPGRGRRTNYFGC